MAGTMNEKLKILKMLEDKLINADEAARLLESLDGGAAGPGARSNAPHGHAAHSPPPPPTDAIPAPPPSPRPPEHRPPTSQRPPTPTRSFDDVTHDLGRKFEAFAKDMEPKLQKFTETVAEKIVSGADRLSKSLSQETAARPHAPSHTRGQSADTRKPSAPAPVAGPAGFEKNIEMEVEPGYNELSLTGLNGDVRIKGYNGDKITARVTYKPRRSGATIDFMRLGARYFIKYEEDDFERVAIDAYIPERLFQVIQINGLNGNMDVSSLAAREMQLTNANGQTRLAGIGSENLRVECSNGSMTLGNIAADVASIENFNGHVDAEALDIGKLSLTNYNGALSLLISSFERYEEYLWAVETSNAKMTINVPTLPDLGYHIKAHTTLGDIRVGLTGLQFMINDPAFVEARSSYFDRAKKRVKLTAETSNAQLTIN